MITQRKELLGLQRPKRKPKGAQGLCACFIPHGPSRGKYLNYTFLPQNREPPSPTAPQGCFPPAMSCVAKGWPSTHGCCGVLMEVGPSLKHSLGSSCPGAGSWGWARSRPSPVPGGLWGSPAAAPSTAGARRVPTVLLLLYFGAVCAQPASALCLAPKAPCPPCWSCLHPLLLLLLLLPWLEERCQPSCAANGTANHGDVPRAP